MPQATYDAIAEWYDEQVRTDLSPFHEMAIGALLELLGDLQDARSATSPADRVSSRASWQRGARTSPASISRSGC